MCPDNFHDAIFLLGMIVGIIPTFIFTVLLASSRGFMHAIGFHSWSNWTVKGNHQHKTCNMCGKMEREMVRK